MAKIPRDWLVTLLARIDIVDLIDARVPLKKKSGNNYFGCCPFHQEKTASFSVSQDKQFYHCFGCGAHGNAIDFVMQNDRLDFMESVKQLAARVGLTIPEASENTDTNNAAEQQSLFQVLVRATNYFNEQLKSPVRGEFPRTYITQRGLTAETIQAFSLGYAPSGWEELTHAVGANTALREMLVHAGLIVKKDPGKYYDRFRHRIMFPIHDRQGRVIGFGGRALQESDKEPKYLNSPETAVFQKGRELYGLYQVLKKHRNLNRAIIVEGYMDVIALHQHGIDYAVATLGTATTRYHLERLLRYTKHIIFCFDGDNAGRMAAWRALEVLFPLAEDGIKIQFLFLPDGEDPDSLVQKEGKINFEARVDKALTLADYFFNTLSAEIKTDTREDRAAYTARATHYLNQLPAGTFRDIIFRELSSRVQFTVAPNDVQRLKTVSAASRQYKNEEYARTKPPSMLQMAIALILQHPELASEVTLPLPQLEADQHHLLDRLLEMIQQYPQATTAILLENFRDQPEQKWLIQLTNIDLLIPKDKLGIELKSVLQKINLQVKQEAIERLLAKSSGAGLNLDEKEHLQMLIREKE